MKSNNLFNLIVLFFLCALSPSLFAQITEAPLVEAAKTVNGTSVFEYSNISLSDPSIYADEPFSISLTVKNTSSMDSKHEVCLILEDKAAPTKQRKQAGKGVGLLAGESKTVTFTFKAKDLLKEGEATPKFFVFQLGNHEIGVAYDEK